MAGLSRFQRLRGALAAVGGREATPAPRTSPGRQRQWARSILLLLATSLPPLQAASAQQAAATGDVPYAVLYRALEPTLAMRRYPRLLAVQKVESKLDGVAPASIRIRIGEGRAAIDVAVAPDGAIDFPLDAALLAANPPVRTNQPSGSLTLSVTLALRVPPGPRVDAASVRDALAEADALMAATAASGQASRARGAEFRFERGAGASLTLHGSADRVLVADAEGRIVLMREPDLQQQVTELEFSTVPLLVVPWLGR